MARCILAAIGGGGFYAWQQGLLDQAVDKGTELVESTTQTIQQEIGTRSGTRAGAGTRTGGRNPSQCRNRNL